MENFYFMDDNNPGIVYFGNQAHMHGLAREGGCPSRLTVQQRPIADGKMLFKVKQETVRDEWWDIRVLEPDHFWTWSDEKYYRRD